jgi:carbon storage regulator
MLRREGEAILMGEDIEVRILSVRGSKVKIGITAPRAVAVRTLEVELASNENRAAAQAFTRTDRIARLLETWAKHSAKDEPATDMRGRK